MGAITEAKKTAVAPVKTGDFKGLLEREWGHIAAVAPKHMSQDRLFQLAMSTYNRTPGLAECTPVSVLSCLMKCASLGLEPSAVDGLGRAYILPFFNKKSGKKEATFIMGYKGMIDLARRSGEIVDISARSVHKGDTFIYEYGLDEKLRHVPGSGTRTAATLTHVYMIAHFKGGGHYLDVMTKAEIDEVRSRSKSAKTGPWETDYIAMACKSIIRRSFKFLPVSVESQQAAVSDETTPETTSLVPSYLESSMPVTVDVETGEVLDAPEKSPEPESE